MKSRHRSFNIYFALLCLVLAAGCASPSSKKEQTTIRLYLEGQRANKSTSGTVLVTKERIPFTVEREQFLDEGDLSKASIVEDPDGTFYIQLGFNDHGTLVLDMYTSSNKGKHIIVFSQFPVPGKKAEKARKARKKSDEADDSDLVETPTTSLEPVAGKVRESAWLTAVLIKDRISSGTFRFTPDATRKESNRIVRGLRNVIAENKKHDH
jgi:hypothetical protein